MYSTLSPTTSSGSSGSTNYTFLLCVRVCVCILLASLSFFSKRTNAFFRCRLVNIMWHNFFSLHKNRERAIVDWFGCMTAIIFFRFLFYFLLSIFFSYLFAKYNKKEKSEKGWPYSFLFSI